MALPSPNHADPLVWALVDALVEAVDTDRVDAARRVQAALEPFGAASLFAAEVRLNGRSSDAVWSLLGEIDTEAFL